MMMAAMAMPSDAGEDLYLYMHKIIQEEFPKALRQAFNTLWDKKYAPQYGPLDGSCHWLSQFAILDNNFRECYASLFASQFGLDSLSSKSFEELDFNELCCIMINVRFLRVKSYAQETSNSWPGSSELRNREISKIDKRSFVAAVYQLMELNKQHVDCEGRMSSQLLMLQLAHAREVFTSLGVTLNDSKNAIAFSAAGLQGLISGKHMYYSALAPVILDA